MLLILFLAYVLNSGESPLYDQVYQQIDSASFCVRYMNATHKFGCNSKPSGNAGRIYTVANSDQLNDILTGKVDNVIAFLTSNFSDGNTLKDLHSSKNCIGAIINNANLERLTKERPFSPDQSCPNSRHGFYNGDCHSWNVNHSTGQYFYDFDNFPIAVVSSRMDVSAIENCIYKFGTRCCARLKSFMDSPGNSVRCIFRTNSQRYLQLETFCTPLGGTNLHLPLFVPKKPAKQENAVWIAVKLDAMSQFMSLSPAAETVVAGVIAALSVIDKIKQLGSATRPLIFSFFAGEPYDYIGSSRAVEDLTSGGWSETPLSNLTIDGVAEMYEISQFMNANGDLFVHPNEINNKILKDFNETAVDVGMNLRFSQGGLPPSSIQSFLKKNPKLSSAVISGFNQSFETSYYHSVFDQFKTLGCVYDDCIDRVVNVSNFALKFIYKRLTGVKSPQNYVVNKTTVTDLFYCFMKNSSCSLLNSIFSDDEIPSSPNGTIPFAVGAVSDGYFLHEYISRQLMIFYGGKIVNSTKENCKKTTDDDYSTYSWISGENRPGKCYESLFFSSPAISPAFADLDAADIGSDMVANYSTWTVSSYSSPELSLFVSSSGLYQGMVMLVGLVTIIMGMIPFGLFRYNSGFRGYINSLF